MKKELNEKATKRSAKRSGMARRMTALVLAGVLTFGGTATVSAATLKDVFDAQFYAEKYTDLKDAFGTNKKALYKHYKTFGKTEGRTSTELIDVAAYRAAYPDLDAAFGDNWNAYVNHYLEYGFAEGRDSFGTFDARAYADRYEDLKEAFGYDVLALYKHYMKYGRAEGRNAKADVATVTQQETTVSTPSSSSATPKASTSTSTSTPANDSANSATDTAKVATMGQLRDTETGTPIANATVTFKKTSFQTTAEENTTEATESTETAAAEDGTYVVTTDENGYYSVSDFETGVYSVEATAPGYMTLTLNAITINSDGGNFTLPTFEMLSSDMSGTNTIAGTAVDATTGAGMADVNLIIRANWNNQSGDVLMTATTDENGAYSVELARGYYTIEFAKDGYVSNFVNVSSSNVARPCGGVLNPTGSTTEVASTDFRIVLTWGETPYDLDSHLVGLDDQNKPYHICYYNTVAKDEAGNVIASLDVDDVDSYGPETVTVVNARTDATYYYSVRDYSNGYNGSSVEMSQSGANVKVYQGSVLVKEYNVPLNQAGYIWNVFKIENGRVIDINNYNSDENSICGEYNPELID